MDGGGAPKSGVKITFVILAICVLVCLGCYFYSSWADARADQELIPKLLIADLVRTTRQYQKQTGQFPNDLSELEGRVWHHKTIPDFGVDKRRLLALNYYYVYTRVSPLSCAIWAIPSGPKREGATTVFLVVGVDVIRNWKGPTLEKGDIEKLPLVPTTDQLNVMGMTEQPLVDQRAEKTNETQLQAK